MTENKGRNIKPMIIDAWDYISGFSYCLHLHTKKTKGPGENYGLKWLESICSSIATSIKLLVQISLREQHKTGMILPKPFEGHQILTILGGNREASVSNIFFLSGIVQTKKNKRTGIF